MPLELIATRYTGPSQIDSRPLTVVYRANDANDAVTQAKAIKLYKPAAEQEALRTGQRVKIGIEELVRGTRDYEVAVMELFREVPYVVRLGGIINYWNISNGIWVQEKGTRGLVREWAEGEPLSKIYEREEVCSNPELLKKLFSQYLDALISAAEKGFSFADIKPEDIIVNMPKEEIRIVDLNLAEPLSGNKEERLKQSVRDYLQVTEHLFPNDYDHNGMPKFRRTAFREDEGLPTVWRGIFIKKGVVPYESSFRDILYEGVVHEIDHLPNRREYCIGEAKKRMEIGERENLDLSNPESFVRSLRDNEKYHQSFINLAGWGLGVESGKVDIMLAASQLFDQLHNLFGIPRDVGGEWDPLNIIKIALQLQRETEEKS